MYHQIMYYIFLPALKLYINKNHCFLRFHSFFSALLYFMAWISLYLLIHSSRHEAFHSVLWITVLRTFPYVSFGPHDHAFLWSTYWGMELLGHEYWAWSTLLGNDGFPPRWQVTLHHHWNSGLLLYILTNTGYHQVLKCLAAWSGIKLWFLNPILLIINELEHVFMLTGHLSFLL